MNSALLEDLAETMSEAEKCFTAQLLQTILDAREHSGSEKVSARRVALILKTLGEDLEQALNRRQS